MNDSSKICSEGWEAAQILAYVEGNLEAQAERELVRHLRECRVCALEFESLKRLDYLLKKHPEIFHPSDDDLYRFAAGNADPQGQIELHVKSCSECAENVRVFRDMIALSSAAHPTPKMPAEIERQVERIFDREDEASSRRFFDFVSAFLKKPFSLPMLGLASAAAALIVAAFVTPMWRMLGEVAPPAAVPIAEKPAETIKDQRLEFGNLRGEAQQQAPRENAEQKSEAPKASPIPTQAPSSPAPAAREPESPEAVSRSAMDSAPRREAPAGLKDSSLERKTSVSAREDREFSARMREKDRQAHKESSKWEQAVGQVEQSLEYKKDKRALAPAAGSNMNKPPAKSGADTRSPVSVLITDLAGRPVPWVNFSPDPEMENRYLFSVTPKKKEPLSEERDSLGRQSSMVQERPGLVIRVTIAESQGQYEIAAKLFSAEVHKDEAPLKTIVESNVTKELVSERVASLVRSLLQD